MGHSLEFGNFLDIHRNQLDACGIPQHFWPILYQKLINEIFDAGNTFQILKCEESDEHEPPSILQAIKNINMKDSEHIYLIDHAWTFQINRAKSQLSNNNILFERIVKMFGISTSNANIETIWKEVWRFANWYSIQNPGSVEDSLPSWYLMDEVGLSVWHSDNPNCRIVPFVYAQNQLAYSLLFPIKNIQEKDFLFRDFAEGLTNLRKEAYLQPWQPTPLADVDIEPDIPNASYFLSGHFPETLPDLSNLNNNIDQDVLKVYSEYEFINTYLSSDKFEKVISEDEADVLWYTKHFRDYAKLSLTPSRYVNQFPYEYVLTVKDLLCTICRKQTSGSRTLIPTTYNLITELHNFIKYFRYREEKGLENVWIVKPYNLARGLDIHITDNVNFIIRLSTTGPKIVQKYITNPVLFYRPECMGKVKFDVRYVLLLKQVKPLEAYVYKNFFLRFANKPFQLNDFDIYEKHFTVMNYSPNVTLKHMTCKEFLVEFSLQYPDISWRTIETSITQMLANVLKCSTNSEPPCGIGENPQSRAMYAADIILEWDEDNSIVPKLLEINFMPDCQRACDYYPNFFDDVFECLFCDKNKINFIPLFEN